MIDYNQLAADYARHRRVHPEVLQALLHNDLSRSSQVLEVGCGTGNYINAIEALAGCSCWGSDPSEQMLAKAKANAHGVQFVAGRAELLDFPPGFFDFLFSVDVIHHVSDRPRYFGEASRVLKPAGRLITVTDSEWIIRHRQPLSVYFPETIAVELRRYPPIALLKQEMQQAGFNHITEQMAEYAYELSDSEAYRDKAFSSLHLIPPDAFERGMKLLERDLHAGPIPCVSRYVLIDAMAG